ncbi:MAG: polysaccharide biosynthesis protein [Hungatella hathewayi]|nr:polysaccharide biosynthesis protein [Hungatella hathewayi]
MEKTTVRRSRRKSEQPQRNGTPGKTAGSKKGSNFIVQGSILAVAGIIVRLIGMLYRIPLANKIGDDGNGYYNAAYSIYSILLIMSSYSLPVAVSKMVSARLAKNQFRNSVRILYAALFYATIAGALGFAALWFGADYFATVVIKMPFSAYALRALAPTIWVMAYLGVLRGYFQGHSTMIPTAVSQIFEQIVNAIISIVAAVALFDIGVKSNLVYGSDQYAYAFGAAGGAIGTGAGAVAALLFFLLLTMGYRPTMKSRAKRDRSGHVESYGAISRALFLTIAPIILSSMIYNISTVVDNSIFGNVMTDLKQGERIASDWGVWGKYHLLFNIPVAIANSLSSSLIPSLSRAVAEKNRKQVLSRVASAIRFAMIISIPSAVGLTVLAYPISNLLFPGVNSAMLTKMTMVGSVAVVFFSLSTVTNAVLQGINRMRVPIMNSAIALVIHVGILYGLLYGMKSGIYGVVYANILFALIVCILNGLSIGRALRYRQEVLKTFLIPTVASGIMGAAAYGVYQLIFRATGTALRGRLGTIVCLMPAILVAVLVYFVLLVKLRGVDEDEMRGMPGGTKLIGAARKLHLM